LQTRDPSTQGDPIAQRACRERLGCRIVAHFRGQLTDADRNSGGAGIHRKTDSDANGDREDDGSRRDISRVVRRRQRAYRHGARTGHLPRSFGG
jgi:hypothetical protein